MQPPATGYVERDGTAIAYQVVGDGPLDLLISPGFISHLDLQWADPHCSRFLSRLASFARVIVYDKPGTGLSDPVTRLPTLEERCSDIEAVLDAAGSRQAVLLGISEGGPTSILLAVTQPERVAALILCGTFAVTPRAAPNAYPPAVAERFDETFAKVEAMMDKWGDAASAELFAPSLGEGRHRGYATFERAAASPRMARALIETALQIDVRDILCAVRAPTLVLHRDGDRVIPPDAAALLADRIERAQLRTSPGEDHLPWMGEFDTLVDEIERFVTGGVKSADQDRVLATVMFTDIVDSTRRAAALGDRAWREMLVSHDARVQEVVAEHGGRVVKHIGDGSLSSFEGPARAIRCAETLRPAIAELGIELRTGIHTGECEAIGEDLGGLAVHIGARVGALAGPCEVLVSSTVKELVVGSGMVFSDRGEQALKGVPGTWRVYALGSESSSTRQLDSPADHMRALDRFAVGLARRVPRAMRLGARLAETAQRG